ncbi:UreD-domain-containing protein [Schizopora paradoxa]|uniref:UreD-domain-containing protein n=1 Tax=Schizopora paradoxa TaxID=27342 RepID=A0A0H2SJ23_9AGAM|nr:UreD-domain-containing protein [Schizopora paradoxa]
MENNRPQGDAGNGHIQLDLHGREAIFSKLSYQYPLKLLSPRIAEQGVAIAYVLTYGGGLVSGDRINLHVDVGSSTSLVMLTQGSTKVFKHRPGVRLANSYTDSNPTSTTTSTIQRMLATVYENAFLILLPDPVTCFASASYSQFQTFRLHRGASAVLLDWFTSGRITRGEQWQFSRYYSLNEIWDAGTRMARDSLLLDSEDSQRTLKERLGIYSCYAALFLCGPKTKHMIQSLDEEYQEISVYQHASPPDLIWSLSHIDGEGRVVRIAGKETELVKLWLKDHLKGLEDVVGLDVYSKTFI